MPLNLPLLLAVPNLLSAETMEDLPVNRWVQIESENVESGYDLSPMVYVPSRGQIIQWGGVMARYRVKARTRNDVRAFDAPSGKWVSDYPIAEKSPYPPAGHGAAPRGVTYYGAAEMLPSGTPWPSLIVNSACYDSKRDEAIYTMKGLMAAYDPKAKKWRDMKAKTLIRGKEYPGGPPVYAAGTCYDPVNDEILMFPHWSGSGDPKNEDRLDETGQISGHLGTVRYSFAENTWRRVGGTFGSDEVKKARQAIRSLSRSVSQVADKLHLLRQEPKGKVSGMEQEFQRVLADAQSLELPESATQPFESVPSILQQMGSTIRERKLADALASASEVLRVLEAILDGSLRIEPPARCGAPMLYDAKNRAIVLFGGHSGLVRADLRTSGHLGSAPGALNDTWLYDVTTRQWRELKMQRVPPATQLPQLVYDSKSGHVLLLTFQRGDSRTMKSNKATLWALDVAAASWSKRGEFGWTGELSHQRAYASRPPLYNVGFDPERRLFVFTQNVVRILERKVKVREKDGPPPANDLTQVEDDEGADDLLKEKPKMAEKIIKEKTTVGETWVMRLDLRNLPSSLAPLVQPAPPIRPQTIPPDNPQWVPRLKSLPANTWTYAKPPKEATRRDWGNAACDPVRGHVYYFGGGHSTYQVNDVAIYSPGANQWVHAAGDHNDFVPAVNWGGIAMGFRGGRHAHHQRNQYVAFDGRMYVSVGCTSKVNRYGRMEAGRRPGERRAWFYDVDRGGAWRQQVIPAANIIRQEKADGVWGAVHVVDLVGRIIGFAPDRSHYYATKHPNFYVSIFNARTNRLDIRSAPEPFPWAVPECRPFCFIEGRDQVFYYEYNRKNNRQITWLFDIRSNRFVDLNPKRQPPGLANTVEFLAGQDAVYAVIERKEEWVYSFKHNTWAALPTAGAKPRFTGPYSQVVYSAKYGVLISPRPPLALLRPDVSGVKWAQEGRAAQPDRNEFLAPDQ
ncbi:MAG: kelch repeat-containing protein [Planctomycetota bacterium]|nr:kelch repeat-containing protein [Planctomycetota bacterium]